MMRRSFRSSDGRCHNYHIHCQHECDTGPLVVYLPSTHCEAPLHQASFPFSLLTFEIEPMIGKPNRHPFPKWILEVLLWLRHVDDEQRWSNVDWFLLGCSRGAAWGLEAITGDEGKSLKFKNVMLVAPYLQGPIRIDPILCDKIQQGLSNRVVVFIGENDWWKPCEKLMGMLVAAEVCNFSLPANHKELLTQLRLETSWP